MDEPARKRAAVETYARKETVLRRTARRYSLCADDADDALQRSFEILLRKAPTDDPRQLVKWMQTVVKREAMAVRRERERELVAPGASPATERADWIDHLPAGSDGPAETAERREAVARSREALRTLKPQELRALTLRAEGYSYDEIAEITGYSRTKINRCLAEGRERYRRLVSRSEDGRRCAELRPLLSAFCDGEAGLEEVAQVRDHLRACPHCRASLRAYRAAPAAAAAFAPAPSLDRSLWERAQDALDGLAARFGGGAGEPAAQLAGGGAGGLGLAGAAKVAAVCLGAAGGAAACVAGGLVPTPFDHSPERERPRQERRLAEAPAASDPAPKVDREPAPAEAEAEPRREPERRREPAPSPAPEAAADSEPVAEAAPVSGGEAEYAPPPEPEPEPIPEPAPATASSGGGSPAGEFGP